MKILGVIPARGGSKRIPRKNIRLLNGKPLLAWTIENAIKSGISRVVVSTDDPIIAKIAKKSGAEVPFLRPSELAGDKLGIEPVLKHAFEWYKTNEHFHADAIALLMPTSPLRRTEHIDEAINILKRTKADSVVSVIPATANNNPHWILKRNSRGRVVLFTGDPLTKIKTRSQDLPPCYSRNDVIYLLKPKNLYEKIPNLYGKKVELYVMDEFFDVDINTPNDWFICQQKFKLLKKREW
jgi:CMP-N-acetylneuraminic acid synthetase